MLNAVTCLLPLAIPFGAQKVVAYGKKIGKVKAKNWIFIDYFFAFWNMFCTYLNKQYSINDTIVHLARHLAF